MLSNPTNLQQRQRQHRRQQSTPTAFDATKVSALPTIQRNGSHRRGMSLDQRSQRQSPPQDNSNHILRETQQQRLVRPGQEQPVPYVNLTNDENYLISPLVSPQRQQFDNGCQNSYGGSREPPSPYSPYSGQFNQMIKVVPNDCSGNDPFGNNDPCVYSDSGELSPSAYLDFSSMGFNDVSGQQDWGSTIKPSNRPSRRISDGIADRIATFEEIASGQTRPITPPNQSAMNYFPLTPAHTPYNRVQKTEQVPQRFLDSYDNSMEETIKPGRSRSNQRVQSVFQDMRDQAEFKYSRPLSPPGTAPIPSSSTFDSARMPTSTFTSMKNEGGYSSSHYSPTNTNFSHDMSQPSSPEMSKMSQYGQDSSGYLSTSTSMASIGNQVSHLERSESMDSTEMDEMITETGITIDDIASYISGPDPVDQKWLCLFPECKKKFGRKENIKSHVQTHLGDRQYQCPHCKKCFVRQHDLKRHAKIHSGVKPYPCACGNSFARHDALTRHRQRGMCIGAFEGVVKKVVKRGRPRKNRPDAESRQDKATRTRHKNKDMSSASSTSAYSESSYGHSPSADFEILDEKPFGDFSTDYSQSSAVIDNNFEFSPAPSISANCISPQATQQAASPSAYSTASHHSYHSAQRGSMANIPEHGLPSHPASPAKSPGTIEHPQSQYNTPPELCLGSSSPPTSNRYYDMPEIEDELDLSKLAELQAANDDQMFLDAFVDTSVLSLGMTRLEQDPDLLLMGGKFDDTFAVVDDGDLFSTSGEDPFFGSP